MTEPSAASVREPMFPPGCKCPSYGRGLTMTRVNASYCPVHGTNPTLALDAEATVNHARHEIHEYPNTCMTCAEEFELCACPERCDIHA